MKRTLILSLVLLLAAGAAWAGTTGTLKGTISDGSGAPLPGVTVTVTSPGQLGGARTVVTGPDGSYGFPALDPGDFAVTFELEGFVSQEAPSVQVRLDRTVELNVTLQTATIEGDQVMVTADLPVIDPEQVSISQTYREEYLQKASVGNSERTYQSVLNEAPGVAGGANPKVLGSTTGENAYYVDGFNTTDPVTSTFSGNYSFDVIQEISFQTGGYEAEFGNATGGVVNVITKSGGNDFSGTVDVRYFDESFSESGEFFDPDVNESSNFDPSATLGGPILRDKLWFFAGYNRPDSARTVFGSPTTRTFVGDYYLGKLSWQVAPSWRLVGKINGDPSEIENTQTGSALRRPPETQAFQEQGGDLFQLDLAGVLSAQTLWDIRGGISRRELNVTPISGDLETPGEENISTNLFSVNYRNAQFSDRDRDFLASTLTHYVDELAGSHEFKLGVEYNDNFFSSANFTTGDYFFTRRNVGSDTNDIYRNFTNDPNRQFADFEAQQLSLYLQDAWSPIDRLTLKLGVRYDQAAFDTDTGVEVADLDKVQPRLGLAWDLTGDGKTIARASWGRFMHPSALTSSSFARVDPGAPPTTTAWSCNYVRQQTFGLSADDPTSCSELAGIVQGAFGWQGNIINDPFGYDPEGWIVSSVTGGSTPNVVDPDLDATYQDSIILGVERQLTRGTSIEVSYIDKETEDIFEDTCNGNFPTPTDGAACDFYYMYNIPGLNRTYEGFIARVESRAFDWLHVNASVTISETKGNVEYTQNAGVDFDFFPAHFDNTQGFLADHRDWVFKANGYADLPWWDLILGFDASYADGEVFDNQQSTDRAPYGDEYVDPRGSFTGNDEYDLDLQLSKNFNIADTRFQLIAAVINVFDTERPNNRCQRTAGCGDIALFDPIDYQNPRRYEVGVRLEF